ncbi:DUF2975 domain-containing protein [Tetragenococcus koreensis]|uniref:DUF2975 domain-containing protein n=1 Tax=Tetragenococcus koreensis TaxID=290335 RepID=UPI000F5008C6|nr:DUF2975 domain-containing protein [Tetragenococcus koreensis]AYW46389.1 hypothetical protein C7K43_10890 [Tetragenococcus koreensis]GEN91507.1 hypothetical protein TKO01_15530 [Tetragenococcus koreensis]
MNFFNRFILRILSILTIIGQILCSIAGIGLVLAAGSLLLIPNDFKQELLSYANTNNTIPTIFLIVSAIVGFLIITSIFFVLRSLKKIIDNIYSKQYFVEQNVTSLKKILTYFSIFTISNILSLFFFAYAHEQNVSSIFANSWSQIGIYMIILAIIYTLYLVFKSSMELKNENDSFV